MPQSIVRGNSITLEATVRDVNGDLADASALVVSILDPAGAVVVSNATPVHLSLGRYHYVYPVDASAQLGAWEADWDGTLDAKPIDATEGFTVQPAGAITPDPGAGIQEGPCDWIIWDDVSDYCAPPTITAPLRAAVLRAATRTVWERSCKQFGLCSIARARVTPLCSHAFTWRSGYNYEPGYSAILGWGGCGCGGYEFLPIDLGTAPVASVQGVWINGTQLDAGSYRVDDWRRLVRTDGNTWGPTSLQPDEGGDDTIEVSWTYGVAVPDDGKMAAALLACKYANEVAGDCEPSANATQIIREGVSITINPPKGDTGIVLVEQWLANFQCGGGGVFDPGAHKRIARINT